MKVQRIAIPMTALVAAIFVFSGRSGAAAGNFPIYFPDSRLIVKSELVNRTLYLPVTDIASRMGLPYTDAVALETLTIRSGANHLVVTKNSALISYNGQIVLLPSPMLHESNRWLAPVEFLTMGLSRMTGAEFRYRAGASRIVVGAAEAPQLEMNAQALGPVTRLTLRCAAPITIDIRHEDATTAVVSINRSPLDPVRERLDYRDRLLRSVAFDDSDGTSKLVLDMTREVSDLRVTPAENNRVYFIDLLKAGQPVTAAPLSPPAAAGAVAAAAKPDVVPAGRRVRVIVIDPGHGGMDAGAKGASIVEKDVTLALARRLRQVLQMRLGATVLLTRDSDAELDNQARSAVANNNQANLFISLHAGYSADKNESASSIFVMKDAGAAASPSSTAGPLFLPWYLAYRLHAEGSAAAAGILQDELHKAIPDWNFSVRSAPLAVLSSATMPSVLVEVGNLNNSMNAQRLTEPEFQARLVAAISAAVQRFSESPQAAAN